VIRYNLVCDKRHEFESWFQNSAAYDKQEKRGLVSCPLCGSAKVEKAIMAPRLARKDKSTPIVAPAEEAAPAPATPAPSQVAMISPQGERGEVLAALASVDAVVVFSEDTAADIIRRIQPDILVKGADLPADQIVGRDIVEARGGRVVILPLEPGYSTSSIVERIRNVR